MKGPRLIQRSCLQSKYSLRRQLFLAFGTTSSLSIIIVMGIGLLCTYETSRRTKEGAREVITNTVLQRTLSNSARYIGDSISMELESFKNSVELIVEVTRDRFVGYPYDYYNIFSRDDNVPFTDMVTGRRRYPVLPAVEIPLDWNTSPVANDYNYEEYFGPNGSGRYNVDHNSIIDPITANYFMQGACNPAEKDPSRSGYYPGCSKANNDISTGGVVQPTSTNHYIYDKVSDISFLLRAIYEANDAIQTAAIVFANDGAGSFLKYPGVFAADPWNYTSIGCDWMENINPFDPYKKPIGNEKQIERCHEAGTSVSDREFNGLERPWCREQVIGTAGANKTIVVGPFRNVRGQWRLGFGKPIFDRLTGKFIACTMVAGSVSSVDSIVRTANVGNSSLIGFIRWDNGRIVGSNFATANVSLLSEGTRNASFITEIINPEIYTDMKDLIDYTKQWDPETVRASYESTSWTLQRERQVMIAPVPPIPKVYDPNYRPQFLVLVSLPKEEVIRNLDEMNIVIDNDRNDAYYETVLSGSLGYIIILLLIWVVVRSLTSPLAWMLKVIREIIDNPDAGSANSAGAGSNSGSTPNARKSVHSSQVGRKSVLRSSVMTTARTSVFSAAGGASGSEEMPFEIKEYERDVHKNFYIKTELTALVLDFGYMLDGFSGDGAAHIARQPVYEVKNEFRWKEMYHSLYDASEFSESGDYLDDIISVDEEDGEEWENNEDYKDVFKDEHNAAEKNHFNAANKTDAFMDSMKDFLCLRAPDGIRASVGAFKKTTPPPNPANSTAAFGHNSIAFGHNSNLLHRRSTTNGSMDINAPPKKNIGRNIAVKEDAAATQSSAFQSTERNSKSDKYIADDDSEDDKMDAKKLKRKKKKKEIRSILTSPLFYWIAGLIAVPTLITMAVICFLTTFKLIRTAGIWLETVEGSTVELEKLSTRLAAKTKAAFIEDIMNQVFGDLHVYSRTAGWLLFDSLPRSSSFTEIVSGINECKIYEPYYECPYFEDEIDICDCKWEDNVDNCQVYKDDESRYLQKRFFAIQSQDADPYTGDRDDTSYPEVDVSPETTMWWEWPSDMPGSERGKLASGYSTTYDRVRVLSAMAILDMAFYNYNRDYFSAIKRYDGTYIGFEADGSIMGYAGCDYSYINFFPRWQSTAENNAETIRPNLCPEGKYGFDCRCRDWYAQGRASNSAYVSPIYQSGNGEYSSTATSPLIDPHTGQYIGQTAFDFSSTSIVESIQRPNLDVGLGSFAFLVTPQTNEFTTEFGGGGSDEDEDQDLDDLYLLSITASAEYALPHDDKDSENYKVFQETILADMTEGKAGYGTFRRRKADQYEWAFSNAVANLMEGEDDKFEEFFIAYEPIYVRSLTPISHADFSRGTTSSRVNIYSIAIAVPISELSGSFSQIYDDVTEIVYFTSGLLTIFIAVQSFVVILVTYKLSKTLLRPIHALSNLVKRINDRSVSLTNEKLHHIDGGSVEVQKVYEAFEKLYKVVRFSNSAIFSGDIETSLASLLEAKAIFSRLGNSKAMGVVSNNIGILILEQRKLGELRSGLYKIGKDNFDESVRIGNYEKDKFGGTLDYGQYVSQLANRCFNRAYFLMLTSDYMDFSYKAMEDISNAKRLDEEAYTFYMENYLIENYVSEIFDSILSRTRGMLSLVRDYGLPNDDLWGIDTLIKKAKTILMERWDTPQSELFNEMNCIGRYQQILDLVIQYELHKDNLENAAKIALKMLVEDSHIVDTIFANAVTVVNLYFKESTKNVILCLDYSASMDGEKISRASRNLRFIYNKYCYDEDFVGFIRFNNKIDTELSFPLEQKGEFESYHKLILSQVDHAHGGSNLYQALDFCVNMVASISMNNTWIVALTDGDPWDEPDEVIHRIRSWNAKRSNKIHVLVITFGEETKRNQKMLRKMKRICNSISQESLHIDASCRYKGLDEMEKVFKQVATVMSTGGLTLESF